MNTASKAASSTHSQGRGRLAAPWGGGDVDARQRSARWRGDQAFYGVLLTVPPTLFRLRSPFRADVLAHLGPALSVLVPFR